MCLIGALTGLPLAMLGIDPQAVKNLELAKPEHEVMDLFAYAEQVTL